MTITERPVDGWDSKVPRAKAPNYPNVPSNCPKLYPVVCAVAPRGAGKTWAVCELIRNYQRGITSQDDGKPLDQRVIVFSPTIAMNHVFDTLDIDEEDKIDDCTDGKLQGVIEGIQAERDAYKRWQDVKGVFKKWQKHGENKLEPEELMTLDRYGYELPDPSMLGCKHPNGVVYHLVFDDCLGSQLLRNGRSPLTWLTIRNRHHSCCIYFCVQHMKGLPASLRNNVSLYLLFKFANAQMIMESVYPEVSGLLTEDKFNELYEAACDQSTGGRFLTIDFSQPQGQRFKKCFTHVLDCC